MLETTKDHVQLFKLKMLVVVACLSFGSHQAQGQARVKERCTQPVIDKLEDQSFVIRDWKSLQNFHRRYVSCFGETSEDASVQTGISESVVRIFADHWNTLPTAQRLFARDPELEKYALAGLNVTDTQADLDHIDKLAKERCHRAQKALCAKIRKAIRTNF